MTNPKKEEKNILISDEKHGLPFSKGLIASSIMATGIPPNKAYEIAKSIEDYLKEKGIYSIKSKDLTDLVIETMESKMGADYARKYKCWLMLGKLDKPLIVLIGGTTGVGKSTIATEVGSRLGITHIIPSDAIREVMRTLLSRELMPVLYRSSFDSWKSLRMPFSEKEDPVIVGFKEQAEVVNVGLTAVVQRAVREGINMIIEGVHIVPGFMEFNRFNNAVIVPLIIPMEAEDLHRSHFYVREVDTGGMRSLKRYRANFENIRKVGEYIEKIAAKEKVPLIPSYSLDKAIQEVVEAILNKVVDSCSSEIAVTGSGKEE